MENKENLQQLLHDYGYPEDAIGRFIKEYEQLSYEEARLRIMPYKDITADPR